jgi:flagellin
MSRIQTNVAALNAQRNLTSTGMDLEKSIARLSSGFRINRAGDDAAGLSIANKLRADTRALRQASRNASQAGALVQVAEGAVGTLSGMLDRMKELATQAASDNVTSADRTKINQEFTSLRSEITRIVANTKYQGSTLLDGTYGSSVVLATSTAIAAAGSGLATTSQVTLSGARAGATVSLVDTAGVVVATSNLGGGQIITQQLTTGAAGAQTLNFNQLGISLSLDSGYVQGSLDGNIVTSAAAGGTFIVGSGANADDKVTVTFGDLTVGSTGFNINTGSDDLTTSANALLVIPKLDAAISTLNSVIGTIGAVSNRLEFASQNLGSMIQNFSASESIIRDADMAFETIAFTKNQILAQAATAMLAQANSAPQGVLSLLRG